MAVLIVCRNRRRNPFVLRSADGVPADLCAFVDLGGCGRHCFLAVYRAYAVCGNLPCESGKYQELSVSGKYSRGRVLSPDNKSVVSKMPVDFSGNAGLFCKKNDKEVAISMQKM